ncbi:MAG TPA: YraN family protein [bacterium]
MDRRVLGAAGEAAAVRLVQGRRYRILERNFRCRLGEIDLIAEDRGTIVFIEVKARAAAECGAPFEAISPHKQRRLARLATWYLARRRWLGRPCRFDAVAVMVDLDGRIERIELLRDAFTPDP